MTKDSHSLTAYKLEFSYMERNNPLKDELKDQIRNKERPAVKLEELLEDIVEKSSSVPYIKVGDFAFKLNRVESSSSFDEGKKYVTTPDAGKANASFTVYKPDSKVVYHYGPGSVSTYSHNVYFYDFPDAHYMICHRKGGSGCKFVFTKVLNECLKAKGAKVETVLLLPTETEDLKGCEAQKIILRYERNNRNGDIADSLRDKKGGKIVKELSLNLRTDSYSWISSLLSMIKAKKITSNNAFIELKKKLNDDDYNDADLVVKFNGVNRRVSWNYFSETFGGKFITPRLDELGGATQANIEICADEYIREIRGEKK